MEGEIAQLKEQLEAEKGDVQRRKMLKDLENELAHTEQQYERLQADTAKHKESLGVVRSVTQDVFTRIGCSADEARVLCGTTECNDLTLLPFLGIIEQRTNDILVAYQNAAQNERRRRMQTKDEEQRRRKERKAAERQARIEAGETSLPPEDEDDEEPVDDDGDAAAGAGGLNDASAADSTNKSKFIGVPPSVPHNAMNASHLVRQHGLPNTNAGCAQMPMMRLMKIMLSHEVLRQQMEQRLQQRRERMSAVVAGGKEKRGTATSLLNLVNSLCVIKKKKGREKSAKNVHHFENMLWSCEVCLCLAFHFIFYFIIHPPSSCFSFCLFSLFFHS